MYSKISQNTSFWHLHPITHSIHYFLIRRNRCIELITSQSVFDYIANGNSVNTTVGEGIKRTRSPFVPRTMSIRKAFNIMTERVAAVRSVDRRTSRCC